MPARGDPRAQRRHTHSVRRAACLAAWAFTASGLAAWLTPDAFAQGQPTAPRWPTAQEIERAKAERPFPAPEAPIPAPRALPRIGAGSGAGPGAAQRPPASGAGIDIGALARQGSQIGGAIGPGALPPQEPALRIFVTLDMPQGSLRRLVDQAERAGAVLVLRGLKNQSMRQTVAAVSDLLGERKAGWVIDPEAFERHGVEAAPTFLLTMGEDAPTCSATTCTVPRPFVSVSGDVSLDYALEHMARRHTGAAAVAGPYLSRLRPR
ncbi:MAG: type-F conjugative transfer system pilin assembly protein TrbC [Rubrivivax sp.]|nr:type-F conjugative transfer system pilin assembly protein TrbC [Rubrivivax sp.]